MTDCPEQLSCFPWLKWKSEGRLDKEKAAFFLLTKKYRKYEASGLGRQFNPGRRLLLSGDRKIFVSAAVRLFAFISAAECRDRQEGVLVKK